MKIVTLGIFAAIRSGTTFMRRTLRDCNIDVGHMMVRSDGVVLYNFNKTVNVPPFANAWHQTRDPLKSIASIAASAQMFWRDQAPHIPDVDPIVDPYGPLAPRYVNAMTYWLWWSERCEQHGNHWRYRVEDVFDGSDTWLEIVDRLQLGDVIYPGLPTDTNTKPHAPATWDDLMSADPILADRVAEKSMLYGY